MYINQVCVPDLGIRKSVRFDDLYRNGMAGVLLDDHVRCPCNFIGLIRFQLFYFLSIPSHQVKKRHVRCLFFCCYQDLNVISFGIGPQSLLASLGLDFPHLGVC